jgi:hypothetical protein
MKTIAKARTYVPVIGFKNFAPRTPALLNGGSLRFAYVNQASTWPFHMLNAALIYQHGGGPFVPPRIMTACRLLGRPIVKHWLGSDVMRARDPLVQAQNATGQIVHWANAPWLTAELGQAGIAAQTVSNLGTDGTILPLPPGPLTVLTFLPSFEFYGGHDVLALARALPDIRFLVVASNGKDLPHEPNVEYLGYRDDMRAVYERSHLLLRMPEHDGKSRMVCEALAYGRHVIWNYPMVGSRLATTRPLAAALLRRFDDELHAGRLAPNRLGHDHILAHESTKAVRDQVIYEIEQTIAAWGTRIGQQPRAVGIGERSRFSTAAASQ